MKSSSWTCNMLLFKHWFIFFLLHLVQICVASRILYDRNLNYPNIFCWLFSCTFLAVDHKSMTTSNPAGAQKIFSWYSSFLPRCNFFCRHNPIMYRNIHFCAIWKFLNIPVNGIDVAQTTWSLIRVTDSSINRILNYPLSAHASSINCVCANIGFW
jgi:hypothetical protein